MACHQWIFSLWAIASCVYLTDFMYVAGDSQQITFQPPKIPKSAVFCLYFQAPSDLATRLVQSLSRKEGRGGKHEYYDGYWSVEIPTTSAIRRDYALVMKSKGKHHAVAARLPKIIDFTRDQLVVQYEVKFQIPLDCGGAYLKLLSRQRDFDLRGFNDRTPYTMMFGPDRCDNVNKLHFIVQYKNPRTGQIEEKRAKQPTVNLEKYFTDKRTHLYTLVLNSDNSFEVFIDQILVISGNLLSDIEPPVNPPKEIDDPKDLKPSSWDDREKIPDPNTMKPDSWDESQPEHIDDMTAEVPDGWLHEEPTFIPDPHAKKPRNWDDRVKGEYRAPLIANPKCKSVPGCGQWTRPKVANRLYKGKWSPPLIDNPHYQGVWQPRRIPNPKYFEDHHPYRRMTPIEALGLELWSMTDEIAFDNFLITFNKTDADEYAKNTWFVKIQEERKSESMLEYVLENIRDMARSRPWLWTVLLSLIGMPLMMILTRLCNTAGQVAARSVIPKQKTPDPFSLENLRSLLENQDSGMTSVAEDSKTSLSRGNSSRGKKSSGKIRHRRK